MDILKHLKDESNLIIFTNDSISNNTEIKIKNNHLLFDKGNEFFVFFDNYTIKNDFIFEIKNKVKIYLLTSQSKKADYSIRFELKEASELTLFTDFNAKMKTSSKHKLTINLAKKAKLTVMNALVFNGKIDFDLEVNLLEELAEVMIEQLNVGADGVHHMVNQRVNHLAKSTTSKINNWLIAQENAKLNYHVTGFIEKGKELSKCHQNNKGIMLSDNSEISVEPKLLIDEYNVEASHGAAIGQMDELQLYYLMSRGMTESEAKSLIINGYTLPFISLIANEKIEKILKRQVSRVIRRNS
jgi:Fe-S cluster assembly protein SufD